MFRDKGPEFLSKFGFNTSTFIGAGQFGSVYLENGKRDRLSAIKVPAALTSRDSMDPETYDLSLRRLRREYQALTRGDGIPVVPGNVSLLYISPQKLYQNGVISLLPQRAQECGTYVLIRDFVVGQTIDATEETISQENKRQLSDSITACHERGMACLNISPHNTLVGAGMPKLIGLGTALFREDVTAEVFERYSLEDFQSLENLIRTSTKR